MIIEKKTHSFYFEKIVNGEKTFDVRLADWECEPGDTLVLKEFDPIKKSYTGRKLEKEVSFVLKTKEFEKSKLWPKEDIKKYGFQVIGFK